MTKYPTFRLAGVALVFSLAGCAVEPASQAILDAYKVMRAEGSAAADGRLNPNYKYLRVQVGERVLFMARGYLDPSPDGPVEVWYSADRNVLRLLNGRVVGVTMKSGIDWSAVTFSHLPAWNELGGQAVFERTRDVNPGYRYGIRDKMLIRRILPPADTNLKTVPASALVWYEESVQGGDQVRSARYAVDDASHKVVYAEQCLSAEFCLSWQSWPHSSKGTH